MIAKRVSVFGILFIIFSLTLVAASATPTASRNLPDDCVQPNDQFTVQISASDYGTAGQVKENLGSGMTYVSSSLDSSQVTISGSVVSFYLLGETDFSYTVQAPSTSGTSTISGTIRDIDKNIETTGGESQVCVGEDGGQQTGASATRDLPDDCVQPGETFTVQISASDYGSAGQIKEILCSGWTYVSSSLDPIQVAVSGNTVTFTLVGETSFTYTVQASSTPGESCTLSGTIQDIDKNVKSIGGETEVCVSDTGGQQPGASATRDLPACIGPDEQFTVLISVSDYGSAGQLTETLCDGWTYIGSSLDESQVAVSGNTVKFTLLDETSFSYTVQAPSNPGDSCSISGNIKDFDKKVKSVSGDSLINVCLGPQETGIILKNGWNFISVPCVLENDSVADVMEGVDYEAIVLYDASGKVWKVPTSIKPLTGYAIKVNNSTNQVITNIACSGELNVPASVQLYKGWNAVGLTGLVPKTAEFTFYVGDIDDNYSKVWGPWDPVMMKYKYHGYNQNVFGDIPGGEMTPDVYTEHYTMKPFEGHWVYLTENAVLSAIA